MSRLLAVDPSIRTAGWAVFDTNNKNLLEAGEASSRNKNVLDNGIKVVNQILEIAEDLDCEEAVIEEPAVMFGSAQGDVSSREGSTVKLSIAVGMLLYGLYTIGVEKVTLIPVAKWKGNLSKSETKYRVERIIGTDHGYKSEHILDSVGLGLYYMGYLK